MATKDVIQKEQIMYHIPEDKRAIKSAHLIGEGLLQLLKKMSFNEISIASINKETGISRATFYRLFDRVEDVLEYLCDEMFEEIQRAFSEQPEKTAEKVMVEFIQKWMEKDVLVECLSENCMMNVLCKAHLKKKDLIYTMFGIQEPLDTGQMDYMCYFLAYMIPMALDVWILHDKRESAEMLYKNFLDSYRILGRQLIIRSDFANLSD